MSEFKHTPGPWFRDTTQGQMGIVDKNKSTVVGGCGCCGSPFGVHDHDEAEANAVLIESAPLLLGAIQFFLMNPNNDICDEDRMVAEAIIAKATTQQDSSA